MNRTLMRHGVAAMVALWIGTAGCGQTGTRLLRSRVRFLRFEGPVAAARYPMPICRKYARLRLAIGSGLSNGAGYMSCSTMAQP